jgi:hypothetical protein
VWKELHPSPNNSVSCTDRDGADIAYIVKPRQGYRCPSHTEVQERYKEETEYLHKPGRVWVYVKQMASA